MTKKQRRKKYPKKTDPSISSLCCEYREDKAQKNVELEKFLYAVNCKKSFTSNTKSYYRILYVHQIRLSSQPLQLLCRRYIFSQGTCRNETFFPGILPSNGSLAERESFVVPSLKRALSCTATMFMFYKVYKSSGS